MLDNAEPLLSSAWHAVAISEDVGSVPLHAGLLGRSWSIARDGASISARGLEGDRPARVEERYGLVWLAVYDPGTAPPVLPEMEDAAYATGTVSRRTTVSAGVLVDNFLDVSHFSYLHRDTFGRQAPVTTAGSIVEREGTVLRFTHATDLHEGAGTGPVGPGSPTWRVATYSVLAPYVVHLQMCFPATNSRSAATLICQPEATGQTTVHVLVAWPATDHAGLRAQLALSAEVLAEDLAVLELMADPRLSLSLAAELHTKADRASVEYRRLMADYLGAEVTSGATHR